jgi:SAM-dependent methyltransferase
MGNKDFYDKYWQAEEAVPERDPTTEQRKSLLRMCLSSLDGNSKLLSGETSMKRVKVLDAGCGNGEFSKFIKSMGFDVVGIDISQSAIKKAIANNPDIDFKIGSVEDPLPFADGEFDVIWTTEVLEHVFDIHTCLSQFNCILSQGGQLILTVPYHGTIKNTAIALFGFERHFNPDISHIRFFTKSSLNKCLIRTGFKPLFWKGIGRCWPFYKSIFMVAEKTSAPEKKGEIIG